MRIPALKGIIDRRILINYRVELGVLKEYLPAPFKPLSVNGYGIAGICLIRLKQLGIKGFPAFPGMSFENAAHRIAVEWEENGVTKTGVFIPKRSTSSRLTALTGGKFFPGKHVLADFTTREKDGYHEVQLIDQENTYLTILSQETTRFPLGSVFQNLTTASEFFQKGSVGYSPRYKNMVFEGLELKTFNWRVQPLRVNEVRSSFFENEAIFPKGSIFFDHALLMKNIRHEWHALPEIITSHPIHLDLSKYGLETSQSI
ncbi:MAG: DUF2071 domain-containing protein [Bacteroidetes bacterium]|nr:DUF2071 domain-containing protein [Bacteroidota bacterium]